MSDQRPSGDLAQRDVLATDEDREHALTSIRDAYSAGALAFVDLGERIDRALSARTIGDLDAIKSDLPVRDAPRSQRLRRAVAILRAKMVRLDRGEQISAGRMALLGGCTVDLREAWIAPGPDRVAQLSVVSVFGSVRPVVPPGVRVSVEGDPFVIVTRVGDNSRGRMGPASAYGHSLS